MQVEFPRRALAAIDIRAKMCAGGVTTECHVSRQVRRNGHGDSRPTPVLTWDHGLIDDESTGNLV